LPDAKDLGLGKSAAEKIGLKSPQEQPVDDSLIVKFVAVVVKQPEANSEIVLMRVSEKKLEAIAGIVIATDLPLSQTNEVVLGLSWVDAINITHNLTNKFLRCEIKKEVLEKNLGRKARDGIDFDGNFMSPTIIDGKGFILDAGKPLLIGLQKSGLGNRRRPGLVIWLPDKPLSVNDIVLVSINQVRCFEQGIDVGLPHYCIQIKVDILKPVK
jgi:hypothetical protein